MLSPLQELVMQLFSFPDWVMEISNIITGGQKLQWRTETFNNQVLYK